MLARKIKRARKEKALNEREHGERRDGGLEALISARRIRALLGLRERFGR